MKKKTYSKILTMLEATGDLEKLTEEDEKKGDVHDNAERSKQ